MGYLSNLSGEMTFSRPLNRKETMAATGVQDEIWTYYELSTETEARETDEGTLTIIRALGIKLLPNGEVKADEWQSALQHIVSTLPDDVTVSGYFERISEESPDVERLYVVGHQVVCVKPTWIRR